MDETIDDFQENFKLIKEKKKLKLAQISNYLSPKPATSQNASSSNLSNTTESSLISPNSKSNFDFRKPKTKKSSSSHNDSKISKYFVNKESGEKKAFNCPICSANLTNLMDANRQKHVNECLDKGFAMNKEKKKIREKS